MQDMEDRADCIAAIRMRDEFGYNAEDMVGIYDLILDTTSAKDEQSRWANVVACYEGNIPVMVFAAE